MRRRPGDERALSAPLLIIFQNANTAVNRVLKLCRVNLFVEHLINRVVGDSVLASPEVTLQPPDVDSHRIGLPLLIGEAQSLNHFVRNLNLDLGIGLVAFEVLFHQHHHNLCVLQAHAQAQ